MHFVDPPEEGYCLHQRAFSTSGLPDQDGHGLDIFDEDVPDWSQIFDMN